MWPPSLGSYDRLGRPDTGADVERRDVDRLGRSAAVVRKGAARAGCTLGAAALTIGLVGAVVGAVGAGPAAAATVAGTRTDPGAGHPYRHGAVPLKVAAPRVGTTSAVARIAPGRRVGGLVQRGPVVFGGGSVLTGSPAVYLVFWGSRWGVQSTDSAGYDAYSGDPEGLAPNLQALFSGLGTDGEQWSAVLTQYCQGVVAGAKACPLSPLSDHVAYPSATVLRGVWEDTSADLSDATGTQIAQEAADAALHFSDPPGAQYIIVSPTGADPDGWLDTRTGYCAYHDDTGDPSLGLVTGPDVAYTNMPYVPDVGADCSSFTDPGVLDGADETISHEYAETLTDPLPSTGWTDRHREEVADKCENLPGGSPGGSTYVTLATGLFALQGVWANDLGSKGGCETSHEPILTVGPGKQRATVGRAVSLQVEAANVRGQTLHFGAAGLPLGLAVNPVSGLITGDPTTRGRSHVTVTVTDTSAGTSLTFVWLVQR